MEQAPIDRARLERFLTDARLRVGPGSGSGTLDLCAMQAADWLAGGAGCTDAPPGVDPAVQAFIVRLNDANGFAVWRDDLKPYVARSIDTRGGDATTERRAIMCADWALREAAPKAFEIQGHVALVQQLRSIPPIVDAASARECARIARSVRLTVPAIAASAADAATYALAGSAVLAAAARSAAAAAAYVPIFAAAQARSMTAARELWDMSLAFLDRLIGPGPTAIS